MYNSLHFSPLDFMKMRLSIILISLCSFQEDDLSDIKGWKGGVGSIRANLIAECCSGSKIEEGELREVIITEGN